MNPFYKPSAPQHPSWGAITLADIQNRRPGFYPLPGYHIYCQLRPIKDFEETENDAKATKFVRLIDRYAQMGVEAASSYGLVLLELQGTVLHFLKPQEATQSNTNEVVNFVHEFTQVAYDELRSEMGNNWHGFASAFDHGRSVLINHTSQSTMSTVSLGPCANRPAKRLFASTPAGHVSAPTRLVRHLRNDKGEWMDIDIRYKTSPTKSRDHFLTNLSRSHSLVRKDEGSITNFSASRGHNAQIPRPGAPLRITGSVSRFDLDGFSQLIENAFDQGNHAVEAIANAFKEVMDYAELVAQAHQPCLMLPWAGDCATFILHDIGDEVGGTPRWLKFSMDWQSGSINGHRSPVTNNARLRGTRWAAGAARGTTGKIVAASSHIQQELFLFATGWPYATAKTAQESAKGDQVAIATDDHQRLPELHKKLFASKNDENYWVAAQPSENKLAQLAITAGSTSASPHVAASASVSLPTRPVNRPYMPFDA